MNFHLLLNGSGTPDSSCSSAAADGTSLVSTAVSAAAGRTVAPHMDSGKINPKATLIAERRPSGDSDCRARRGSARLSFLCKRTSFIESAPFDKIGVGALVQKHSMILGDQVLLLAYRHPFSRRTLHPGAPDFRWR